MKTDDRGTSRSDGPTWLALDVGGANLKAAHSGGVVRSSPFAVWRDPDGLGRAIAELAAQVPTFDRVASTMTAELCDCFETKREGVLRIVRSLREGLGDRPIVHWGVDGRFHDEAAIRERPLLAAASNWLALATVAAEFTDGGPALLIDVGSTTADIIPIFDGCVVARGRTDLERLRHGELVYAGVGRTPVCALGVELPFQGRPTGLAAELFATTRDVYLVLGDATPDPKDLATADGRPATVERAIDRLARMVCADRDSCTAEDVRALARAADTALVDRLVGSARRCCEATIGRPAAVVTSGSGEFLARRVAEALLGGTVGVTSLGETWGPAASEAACAQALIELVRGRPYEPAG